MATTTHIPTTVDERPVDGIQVGTRVRQDMGDIEALATSIKDVGLLHPLVLNHKGALIAGARRLAAVKHLGWRSVPVRIVPLDRLVRGEYAENEFRKQWTPSEQVAIKRALDADERAAAKQRQARPGQARSAKFAGHAAKGRSRQKVARATGSSHETLRKAEAVVEAAETDPEKFSPLAEEMDRTGKVDPAFEKVRTTKAHERAVEGLSPDEQRRVYEIAATMAPRGKVKAEHLHRARARLAEPTTASSLEPLESIVDNTVYEERGVTLVCGDARTLVPPLSPDAVIITDPPYNVIFDFDGEYHDSLPPEEYDELLRATLRPPCVVLHRPEGVCRLSRLLGMDPTCVVAWVYDGVYARQWRAIAWFGIKPNLQGVGDWWNIQPLTTEPVIASTAPRLSCPRA